MRYGEIVFDCETDDLLVKCSLLHVIKLYDRQSRIMHTFHGNETGWIDILDNATCVIGHNISGYDIAALEKLFDWEFNIDVPFVDTLKLSEILNYRRFGMQGHSLERFGELLGHRKITWRERAIALGLITDDAPGGAEFKIYHPEMDIYCEEDVYINNEVYEYLLPEYRVAFKDNRTIIHQIQAENHTSLFCARAESDGWLFDKSKAAELEPQLVDIINEIKGKLEPRLGMKCVGIDKVGGEDAGKPVRRTKDGAYTRHVADWFGINPYSGLDHPDLNDEPGHDPIRGSYCRIKFEPLKLSSPDDVKLFLFRNGWVPTEWNTKKDANGKRIQTSPKITPESLELLGGDGALYREFTTAESRYEILRGWLLTSDDKDHVHGSCKSLGTPSFRATHKLIVNVPDAKNPWGKELRELFRAPKGWKLIGCDSKGNQARGLAHQLKDAEYTRILLEEDIHTYNLLKLTDVINEMREKYPTTVGTLPSDYQVPRSSAKRVLYAFLFGAAGRLLWSYIFGDFDKEKGEILKKGFINAVPGFSELVSNLEKIFKKTSSYGKYGYIPTITGASVFVDSRHKLLVYLLQSIEKITCSTAVMYFMKKMKKEGIPYRPRIFMHDEIQLITPEAFAERTKEIGIEAFREGPKLYDIEIMDGSGVIGNNWYETH